MAPNRSMESLLEITKPLFNALTNLSIPFQAKHTYFHTFHTGWASIWPTEMLVVAHPTTIEGSRLFPRTTWTDPDGLTAILSTFRTIIARGHDIEGFLISPGNPFGVDNAVSPALRRAIAHFSVGVRLPSDDESTAEQKATAQEELERAVLGPWREVSPAHAFGGTYLNEANPMEPNWQEDMYGMENYRRLLAIKQEYDPDDVMYAVTGVGSEGWEVRSMERGIRTQNGRLCRV